MGSAEFALSMFREVPTVAGFPHEPRLAFALSHVKVPAASTPVLRSMWPQGFHEAPLTGTA
jgi:hypothetical protein